MKILIKNGLIVNGNNTIPFLGDVLIENNVLKSSSQNDYEYL